MGVVEEVGKSMPWAHVSAAVRGVWPHNFFLFYLGKEMEMKYTTASIFLNRIFQQRHCCNKLFPMLQTQGTSTLWLTTQ